MATLSVCSSPSLTVSSLPQIKYTSISNSTSTNVASISQSLSSLKLTQMPSFVPKSTAQLAEPQTTVPEESQKPKGEEIFAVIMVGSRQYIVFPGRYIYTQRLKGANVNDKIVLNKVLLVGSKTKTWIGKPIVSNAVVHAVVEEQTLDKKVVVFKYKKKKNYRRNIGHRQPITRIRIVGITGYEDSPFATLP
ncbi:ribosomal protein [Lithospermum erythrorhizon]|uniref:Ribosomal protein n=1 Tax=Lithospermum erythrorhizon TaxID=34254 RepID=A0AAV3RYX2_LITER